MEGCVKKNSIWHDRDIMHRDMEENCKRRIVVLKEKLKKSPDTKVVKMIMCDKNRETNNYESKDKQLGEEIRKAKEKKEEVEKKNKEDLELAEKEYNDRILKDGLKDSQEHWMT